MSKPEITIHNAETGEIITREMTDSEYKKYLERQEAKSLEREKESARLNEKNALLEKLGITEDEAKLLLS